MLCEFRCLRIQHFHQVLIQIRPNGYNLVFDHKGFNILPIVGWLVKLGWVRLG